MAAQGCDPHDLYLVEEGLRIYLHHSPSSRDGYRLAASFCERYDPRYFDGLSGPSRARIHEIAEFMKSVEEDERNRQPDARSH